MRMCSRVRTLNSSGCFQLAACVRTLEDAQRRVHDNTGRRLTVSDLHILPLLTVSQALENCFPLHSSTATASSLHIQPIKTPQTRQSLIKAARNNECTLPGSANTDQIWMQAQSVLILMNTFDYAASSSVMKPSARSLNFCRRDKRSRLN